jgi:FkbM family methyltransferase
MTMRDVARRLIAHTGFVVHRAPATRFDSMETALRALHRAGYDPAVVIDCGANRGQWFGIASAIFTGSEFHEVEPQAECWPTLDLAAARRGRTQVHRVAVTGREVASVRMIRDGQAGSTGAFVTADADPRADVTTPATTLDRLLAGRVTADDRALLKLDIEGHELEALRGAATLLDRIEVIVSEVRFFDIDASGQPLFGDVLAFLDARGFSLFDFASLSGRPRDQRLRQGDAIFVRRSSALGKDISWS